MAMRRFAALACCAGMLGAGAAHAQGGAPPPAKPVCVETEVDGVRTLSYDCLSGQLAPKVEPGAAASQTAAEALAKQPSNRLGTFNFSAERNRFGSNWGKSATPQRPAPPK
ncbi:hypothetical protein [Burkholderia alba]|uniref:hypothetical protein n=1 Tax=Burkholderia alba TaxID=2683677 RepID=UPI002B058BE9|nr:hypothetical protein [Burkholderia alba]